MNDVAVAVVIDDETVAAAADLFVVVVAVVGRRRGAFERLVRVLLFIAGRIQIVELSRLLFANDARDDVAVVVAGRNSLISYSRRPFGCGFSFLVRVIVIDIFTARFLFLLFRLFLFTFIPFILLAAGKLIINRLQI